jgi:hypothetical protein
LPCLALLCLALPCLALSCLALPCFALRCLALPYFALPCLALHLALPSCLLTINPKTLFFFPEFPPNPEKKTCFGIYWLLLRRNFFRRSFKKTKSQNLMFFSSTRKKIN